MAKKIDTWTFRAPELTRELQAQLSAQDATLAQKLRQSVIAEVHMAQTKEGIAFSIACPLLASRVPKDQPLEGSDLNALYQRVQLLVEQHWGDMLGLKWEPWLEVEFGQPLLKNGQHHLPEADRTLGEGLALTYRRIWRAEKEAKAYLLSERGSVLPFPQGKLRKSAEDAWAGLSSSPQAETGLSLSEKLNQMDHRDATKQFAYIPDTPQNRAGLESVCQALSQLLERLETFLGPQAAAENLQRLAQGAALPQLLAGPSETGEAPAPRKVRSP